MQGKTRRKPGKKSVVKAECLSRLKAGATPPELLKEFRPGPVYDALSEYLTFSSGLVEEIRRSVENGQHELARIREETRVALEESAARKAEVGVLAEGKAELDEDIEKRGLRVSELRLEEERLDSKLEEYGERGVTDKTFRRLDRISFGSEDELITRLDTVERYLELVSETKNRNLELLSVTNKVNELGREIKNLKAEAVKLRNERDEELSRNYVQSESIRILSTFYKDKYTSSDIEGIRIGLNTLGIKGNPRTSVKRLIETLGGELKLSRLRIEIDARRTELDTLVKTLESVKGQLNSYSNVALASLKEVKAATRNQIDAIYKEAVFRVGDMGQTANKQLESLLSNQLLALDKASKAGVGNLIDIHNEAKIRIDETVDTVRDEVKTTIRQELAPYHTALELIPKMEPFASYGYLLMMVPHNKILANKVPAIFVATMAASIDSWVREMMPEAITKPPKDVTMIAPMLGIEMPCKLFAVSMWLHQELMHKTRLS